MSDAAASPNASPGAALLRAGIAVAAALALMVAVLLMDDARPPEASPPAGPQPAATPPADVVEPQTAVPAPAEGARTETPKAEVVQGEADRTPGPSPAVQAVPEAPVPPAMPKAPPSVTPPSAHAAALAALANQPAAPMKDGYLLQLGVFGNPVNAGALQTELAAKGLPARVESRVVLGPFPDRKSLEAAQRRLKREQGRDAVVVPPRNKGR